MKSNVLFYVQHLLGIGHLKRAATLARAMLDEGLDVHLVCGGIVPSEFDFPKLIRLPALHVSRDSFSELLDSNDHAVDERWKGIRRDKLLQLLSDISPRIIVVETFPFGRRQMGFELTPFLEAASKMRPRPKILCSIRDVVQRRSQKRMNETVDTVKQYFDAVLVHGDANFIAFNQSFGAAHMIEHHIVYTGYVSPSSNNTKSSEFNKEIIVSAGGGAVGDELLLTALHAREKSALKELTWRILAGPNLSSSTYAKLIELSADRDTIKVQPNRSDFAQLLHAAALSISQAGYNTMMDVLRAGVPAVVVPFEGCGETEQILRANALQQAGVLTVVRENNLNADSLAIAMDQAVCLPGKTDIQISLDGAGTTARYIRRLARSTI